MNNAVQIKQIALLEEARDDLSELLVKVVEGGASIGFLAPISIDEASVYWESVPTPDIILFVATLDDKIVGSVQLHFVTKPNGTHRAEIAKLMTHPDYRRNGIARLLMQQAEEAARAKERTLLVLDTREGDPSNVLYTALGFIPCGRIPDFALSETGEYDATIIYFKKLKKKSEK